MKLIRILMISLLFFLLSVAPSHGHPSLTEHPHNSNTIQWELDDTPENPSKNGDTAHNHVSNRDFGGRLSFREPYSARSCWDNRIFRDDPDGSFDEEIGRAHV